MADLETDKKPTNFLTKTMSFFKKKVQNKHKFTDEERALSLEIRRKKADLTKKQLDYEMLMIDRELTKPVIYSQDEIVSIAISWLLKELQSGKSLNQILNSGKVQNTNPAGGWRASSGTPASAQASLYNYEEVSDQEIGEFLEQMPGQAREWIKNHSEAEILTAAANYPQLQGVSPSTIKRAKEMLLER